MDTILDPVQSKDEIAEDTGKLKLWLSKQPHLPHDIEDQLLTAFVRGTKSLEKAKSKLDAYLTFRGKTGYIYNWPLRDPADPVFLKSCEALKIFPLPKKTKEGIDVLAVLPHKDYNQYNHQMNDMRFLMTTEMWMMGWSISMSQQQFVITDLSGVDSSLLYRFNISSARATFLFLEKAFPVRIKKAIYFNAPPFVDSIYSALKPALKNKVLGRVIITSKGAEVLKEHLPTDILPKEYGGEQESAEVLNDRHLKLLLEKRDWFIKSSSQCSDESKRPVDPIPLFGVEGNFKYLQID